MAAAPPALVAKVPEAGGYKLVYDLNVPLLGGKYNTTAVPYSVNDAATVTTPIDRVAYHLELKKADGTTQWVFVSAAAFTQNAKKLGVPTLGSGAVFQQKLSNMTVRSNVPGVVTGSGLAGGNIEFWPSSYGPKNAAAVPNASDGAYDHGDVITAPANGYGSMQLHNATAKQTLLAYNGWGGLEPTKPAEIGIGNSPTGGKDWTFNKSAGQWSVRRLQVLVRPAGAPTVPPPPPPVVVPGPTLTLGHVLPLGDSLTWGYDHKSPTSGGYRSRLYSKLTAAGQTWKFVGSERDTYSTVLKAANQTAHEGHGGFRTDQILGNLLGLASGTNVSSNNGGHWLDGTATRSPIQPNVVLLMAGTNDVLQKRTAASAAANLDKIIKVLNTARPTAKVFVASIPPVVNSASFTAVVKEFNGLAKQLVARYAAAGKKVYFVDQYKNFVDPAGKALTTLYSDSVHPGRAGYDKMGDTWAAAILAAKRTW